MKPTPKELQEHNKYYEQVVEHLIAEGYTGDRDGAESIINGMSEEWYSLIVGE
jgi:SOS response regulatory protein OraA/RecX